MKERFVVLDNYLSEYGQFSTAAAAIKSAQEAAGACGSNEYDEGTYYVAQILGKAEFNKTPSLAPYTTLPALTKAAPKKKASAKKVSSRKK